MRIDRWIKATIGNVPQSLIEKSLRNGKIKLNKKKVKSSTKLSLLDKIYFYNFQFKESKKQKQKFEPTNQIIKENEDDIIDNNDDFIVINKKSGIAVQGGTKSKKNIIDIFSKSKYFQNTKPFSVHRLDKDTSGVFIIAKNRETAKLLTSLFRLRKIYKTYLAVCNGEISQTKGEWVGELIRYDGNRKITEKAITKYKVIDTNNNSTLIQMNPVTGRKHQLRKQLSELDHPIYGDSKYTYNKSFKRLNKQLMLHSYEIKFMINNKKYTYRALLPDYFKKLLITKKLKFSNY
jgi:23S rRNA pseudouridine955/2504/2580 synthase